LTRKAAVRNAHCMKKVLVFHMNGCPACREYMPRFKACAEKFRGKLDVRHLNVSQSVAAVQEAAKAFKIRFLPTTIVLGDKDRVLRRVESAVENAKITELLTFAAGA
jgi:thiol-disulfide isomerase/thioredoxin